MTTRSFQPVWGLSGDPGVAPMSLPGTYSLKASRSGGGLTVVQPVSAHRTMPAARMEPALFTKCDCATARDFCPEKIQAGTPLICNMFGMSDHPDFSC